jgi:hypothetical protein
LSLRVRTEFLLLGAWCFGLVLAALDWHRRGLGVIEGRVVEAGGRPIHAGVWRFPMDWWKLENMGTEPEGRFAVLIPAEECRLLATHADWSERAKLVPRQALCSARAPRFARNHRIRGLSRAFEMLAWRSHAPLSKRK